MEDGEYRVDEVGCLGVVVALVLFAVVMFAAGVSGCALALEAEGLRVSVSGCNVDGITNWSCATDGTLETQP